MRRHPVRDLATGLILADGKALEKVGTAKLDPSAYSVEGTQFLDKDATVLSQSQINDAKQWLGQTGPVIPAHSGPTETQPNGYLNGQVWNKPVPKLKVLDDVIMPLIVSFPATESDEFEEGNSDNSLGTWPLVTSEQQAYKFVSRDKTVHDITAVALVVPEYNNASTVAFYPGTFSFDSEEVTFFNWCVYEEISAGNRFFAQESFRMGVKAIRNSGELTMQSIQLAPGDTHVRFQTGLTGLRPDSDSGVVVGSSEGLAYKQWDVFGVPWNWDGATTPSAEYSVSVSASIDVGDCSGTLTWSLTSWPSQAYTVSGSGNLWVSGGRQTTTAPVYSDANGCVPGGFFVNYDVAEGTPPLPSSQDFLIPVTALPQVVETYVSSTTTRDFVRVRVQQQAHIPKIDSSFAYSSSTLDSPPDNYLHNGLAAQFSDFERYRAEGDTSSLPLDLQSVTWLSPRTGLFSPDSFDVALNRYKAYIPYGAAVGIPAGTYDLFYVYEKLDPTLPGVFRKLTDPTEFDLEKLDWRRQQSEYACRDALKGDKFANVDSLHYSAQEAQLQAWADSAIDTTTVVDVAVRGIASDCGLSTATVRKLPMASLPAISGATVIAAAPNVIKKG